MISKLLQSHLKVFAVAAVLAWSAQATISVAHAATNLNLVFLANKQDEEYDGALVFKHFVEAKTHGSVKVNIFSGSQLCGSAKECFQSLKAGTVDVYTATAGGTAVIYPPIQALDLPYLFTNEQVVKKTLSDPKLVESIRQRILKASGNQIRLLTMSNTGGWRNFATAKKAVHSPNDLKGLKIRTIESPAQQKLVKALGAVPQPLPYMQTYSALQTGVVDGSKNSISDIVNAKFQEVEKYMIEDHHGFMADLWFIGNKKFESLNHSQKVAVVEGAQLMSQVMWGMQPRKELAAYEAFQKAGGKIYVPTDREEAEFATAAKPVTQWFEKHYGKAGQSLLHEIETSTNQAKEELNQENSQAIK